MPRSNYVHIHVDEIRKMTDKAMLCIIDDEEVWLPISQVADGDDYREGDKNLTLSVTEYIAKEKGLEGEK